jgi:hypothetical protein
MPNSRQTWPRYNDPNFAEQVPDATLRSGRSLAGPLRTGTAPGVGPRGFDVPDGVSDFGLDRVSPRSHDPIGRRPYDATSVLITRRR